MATQIPTTLPFTVPSGARDDAKDILAREVFGTDDFSDLSNSNQSKLLTLADDAAFELTNLAKWYMLWDAPWSGPDVREFPAEFNELFRLMWTERALRVFRSNTDAVEYRKEVVDPQFRSVVDNIGNSDKFGDFTHQHDLTTVTAFMESLISVCIRQRTPVIPPYEEGYRTIREEFVKLWEERRWSFRVRSVTLLISGTDGSVGFDTGDIDQFDGFASKFIWLTDGGGTHKVMWLDSERFTRARAQSLASPSTTGRPVAFFTEDIGTSTRVHWVPNPNKDYTGVANIIIKAPPFAANPDVGGEFTGLNHLPSVFRHHLRDRCLARLLSKYGREDNDAQRWLNIVAKDTAELADNWAERGAEAANAKPLTFANRVRELTSYRGGGIIGQSA